MTDKSAEYARDTLNALIAGGYAQGLIQNRPGETGLRLDMEILRSLEAQLREYYSTGPYQPSQMATSLDIRM